MRQRFTFIKTNEVEEDFDEEERVELETVIENTDLEALEEKFENFLKGCGHDDISVTLGLYENDSTNDNSTFSSYDNEEDLEDELEDVDPLPSEPFSRDGKSSFECIFSRFIFKTLNDSLTSKSKKPQVTLQIFAMT